MAGEAIEQSGDQPLRVLVAGAGKPMLPNLPPTSNQTCIFYPIVDSWHSRPMKIRPESRALVKRLSDLLQASRQRSPERKRFPQMKRQPVHPQ